MAISVLNHCGFDVTVCSINSNASWQHPGRTAQLCANGVPVGVLSEINPSHGETFGLDNRTVVMEINMDVLSEIQSTEKTYASVAMYPSVIRDLAFLVDDRTEYATIESSLKTISPRVTFVELFDIYKGEGVKEGKKSVAVHVEFRSSEKTLEAKEVDVEIEKIKKMLEKEFGAILRV